MRFFHIHGEHFTELAALPNELPADGFLWLGYARPDFEQHISHVQQALQAWGCGPLVDLHISDLLDAQLPSDFDYTSWYDLLVFRRLAAVAGSEPLLMDESQDNLITAQRSLASIDTNPVGFAVFDRVLLTVHPADCLVREFFADKLGKLTEGRDFRGSARLLTSPAELMLRMINHMVDGYLELRRLLTRQLTGLQRLLLDPHAHFDNWPLLLSSREALHTLEDT